MGSALLCFVDDSACPLRPVGEKLGFFQGVDYRIARQALPVAVVQDEPDFVALVGGFEAIRVRGLVLRGVA